MSPVQHPITGRSLSFVLADEMKLLSDELQRMPARVGRTLVKDGRLRVTLVGVKAGQGLPEHVAEGPVTIHVLEGAMDVEAVGKQWPLAAGGLLALDGGVTHSVLSRDGAIFLLTVMQPERGAPSAT
ncbi:MAG TPA: cupin domain-containing protein [Gemmatimonadaceae bacterium]|nr:cupin domain-containing protein [Gemmatimonadaceae bacterium]